MKPNADPPTLQTRFQIGRRIGLAVLLVGMCVGSIGFGLYASGTLYHNGFNQWWPQEKPAIALKLPQVLLQGCGLEDGIHLTCMRYSSSNVAVYFERRTHLGNSDYVHGQTCTACGFTGAILTRTFSGGDYEVSPYIAVVLPYWFPPLLFGLTSLWFAIAPRCRRRSAS